jgi:hypothetical protein
MTKALARVLLASALCGPEPRMDVRPAFECAGPRAGRPFRCNAVIPTDDADDVVLNPWRAEPDAVARSNGETVARLGQIQVGTLRAVPRPTPPCWPRPAPRSGSTS